MRKKDDFDDEFGGPDAANAFGSIMSALDLRARFEARKPVYATSIVVALVAVLGSVIWYSYPKESAQREVMNTPIVRADAGDYRTTPAEPGGMAVPYRESTVFNTLRAEEGVQSAKVENLLPQAEQPVSRQELFAGLKIDQPSETAPGVTSESDAVADATAVTEMSVTETVQAPVATQESIVQAEVAAKPAEAKVSEPKAPETKVADAKAREAAKTEPAAGVQKIDDKPKSSGGGFYVQLGSVKERAGADGEWKKLQKSFAALSPLGMRVQEADLGAKGKFFRIQGGPVTEAQAKSICDSVKAQKPGGCLVVRQ